MQVVVGSGSSTPSTPTATKGGPRQSLYISMTKDDLVTNQEPREVTFDNGATIAWVPPRTSGTYFFQATSRAIRALKIVETVCGPEGTSHGDGIMVLPEQSTTSGTCFCYGTSWNTNDKNTTLVNEQKEIAHTTEGYEWAVSSLIASNNTPTIMIAELGWSGDNASWMAHIRKGGGAKSNKYASGLDVICQIPENDPTIPPAVAMANYINSFEAINLWFDFLFAEEDES